MKNTVDKIIRSLYLCTTDSRERMQQSIIENILYSLDMPLEKKDIEEFIKSEFHLEIDNFEVGEVLNRLIAEGNIVVKEEKYMLSESSKSHIFKNVLTNNEIEEKRKGRIIHLLNEIDNTLEKSELEIVANIFNEYIYESFLEHGRNAIKFFMPYSNEYTPNGNILKNKIKKLGEPKKQKAFTNLVSSYADKLTREELDFLESIAIKAEYFFSLGIPEDMFNKTQEFKINGLVILVDTNFIYSILGLHSHKQNENCIQIAKLITTGKLDSRLVFIKKTLTELQNKKNDFDRTITSEDLTYNQMKSLLDSEELNGFAKEYFEKKIIDPETPHPSDKIQYSQKILKSNRIELFNYKFPHLENESYINSKFEDYYDFHNIRNEARVAHGLKELDQKNDVKLEHDIYLREAVISLRKDKNKVNDLNYICLTLDRTLINFDRYANRKKATGKDIVAPNFILPSVFLRKIRPFIPMITDDYKRAFITSITANTIDTSLPKNSDAVQRSMSIFKKMGIDNHDLIISTIKEELFFKRFIESEKSNKQEEFLRSEIDKAYERLEAGKIEIENTLSENNKRNKKAIEERNYEINKLEKDILLKEQDHNQKENDLTKKIEETEKIKEQLELDQSIEKIEYKEKLLNEKTEKIDLLVRQKSPLRKVAENRFGKFKWYVCISIFMYFLIIGIITWKIGWDKMEPFTYFLSVIGVAGAYLYAAIKGKSLDIVKFFNVKSEEILANVFNEFNFENEKLEKLINDRENIINEISLMKIDHKNNFGELT